MCNSHLIFCYISNIKKPYKTNYLCYVQFIYILYNSVIYHPAGTAQRALNTQTKLHIMPIEAFILLNCLYNINDMKVLSHEKVMTFSHTATMA